MFAWICDAHNLDHLLVYHSGWSCNWVGILLYYYCKFLMHILLFVQLCAVIILCYDSFGVEIKLFSFLLVNYWECYIRVYVKFALCSNNRSTSGLANSIIVPLFDLLGCLVLTFWETFAKVSSILFFKLFFLLNICVCLVKHQLLP